MGDRPQSLGIVVHVLEKRVVEGLIDEPGARSLQLMAHAARAPDLDVQVLLVALDRPADRLA